LARPHLSPQRAARILLTRPANLTPGQAETLAGLAAACPEMTALASLITSFAALLAPDPGNGTRLRRWTTDARATDLPHLHSFTRGRYRARLVPVACMYAAARSSASGGPPSSAASSPAAARSVPWHMRR
jgi:hypothetical protein